jgi:hypothetical protein
VIGPASSVPEDGEGIEARRLKTDGILPRRSAEPRENY